MNYRDMTEDQMHAWGLAESEARIADLRVRTAQGLKDAMAKAEQRRKMIGASRSAASSMVSDALRRKRIDAARAAKPVTP